MGTRLRPLTDKVAAFSAAYDVATSYSSGPLSIGKRLATHDILPNLYSVSIYFLERRLANVALYYKTIRNGYWYSTIILILMSSFSVLSGRTSTIFATLDIFMILAFFAAFKPKGKLVAFLEIGVEVTGFFYLNIMKWE